MAVSGKSAAMAHRLVARIVDALQWEPTDFSSAHVEQLSRVLVDVENVLDVVEASFFARPMTAALLDDAVRGWDADLDALHRIMKDLCASGAVRHTVYQIAEGVSRLERACAASQPAEPDLSGYILGWDAPAPEPGYVSGVDNPDRAEHQIVAALQEPLSDDGRGLRLGVCAVGDSGKSTACAGVAACNAMRERFSQGMMWVELGGDASLQTAADAGVTLVFRFCGAEAAKQLLKFAVDKEFFSTATRYLRSVPKTAAAALLIVIDDVLYKKRDLLGLLLKLAPAATPVLFTTRSEAVVGSVPGARLVPFDAHVQRASGDRPPEILDLLTSCNCGGSLRWLGMMLDVWPAPASRWIS